MIYGLTGTHGTGKTTLLNAVKKRGISVNEAQLSRTAQAKLGWDKLSYAQDSLENMWLLQNAILFAMLDRDEALSNLVLDGPVIVDRTPADAWAYTAMWLTRHGIDPLYDPEATIYRKTLESHARNYYRGFIFLPMRAEIPFVEEPNRADLKSRAFVDDSIKSFLKNNFLRTHTITELEPARRAVEVDAFMVANGDKNLLDGFFKGTY